MSNAECLNRSGIVFPQILIPRPGVDLEKWSVIACDQHTSNRGYWQQTEANVGEQPSTLRLILPEVFLADNDLDARIAYIQESADSYLSGGIFQELDESAIWVRRALSDGTVRTGMVVAIDLEYYDFRPEIPSEIRASEQTIPERLPVRAKIRANAAVETPHVLVLLDDPTMSVMEPMASMISGHNPVYETPLMQGGGRVQGYQIKLDSPAADHFARSLAELDRPHGFVFATGDGNHSLAAAKTVWERRKSEGASESDPFRYCLVEIVNVYDPGLPFFAIHRIVRSGDVENVLHLLIRSLSGRFQGYPRESLMRLLAKDPLAVNEIAVITPGQAGVIRLEESNSLAVHEVENVLSKEPDLDVDYVHGTAETLRIAENEDSCAVILPDLDRTALFATVAGAGALPRKAFSLGEAHDKRYYLECRSLR